MNKKKIVVFGLGKIYKVFLGLYDSTKAEIVALCDNNERALADTITEKIVRPEKITGLEFDYVVVTSSYYNEILSQLCGYGIDERCILDFGSIYESIYVPSEFRFVELLKDDIFQVNKFDNMLEKLRDAEEKNLFINAKLFIDSIKDKRLTSLEEAEFQVYSQFGEDGIIQWLIHNVEIENKTFIEFGVEDYSESNTRFLLMNNNWTGFVMDGSEENIKRLKNWKYFWKYDLAAKAAFITKENINELITEAGYSGDIGILSIDLDGNDYWILNSITCVTPRILICEYNNIWGGADKKVSIPYDKQFVRTKAHYSNLYWGGSIAAFRDWAEKKGYYYMGSNSAGNNAFFVRTDCIELEKIPQNANVFVESKYRESRNEKGELTYKRAGDRLECIKEMELVDVCTGQRDTIRNIYSI